MRRLLMLALLPSLLMPVLAQAEEARPDDRVGFTLSVEDWITTKTARVTVNVEAAVSAANAGSMRADMAKAVGALGSADWRMTGFYRMQDQTGMERWSAGFEARLPEASLGGLNEAAKKASKAGMQLMVADIDFSPTLEETEAAKAALRATLYKKAAEQLTTINAAITGRNYRIASMDFVEEGVVMPPPMMPMAYAKAGRGAPAAMETTVASSMPDTATRSQKMRLTAQVSLAAVAPPAAK